MSHQHIHRITYTMARVMGSNKYRPVSSRLVDEADMCFEATRPNDTGHGRVCPSSFRWRVTHKFGSVSFSAWQLHGSGSTRGGRGEGGERERGGGEEGSFTACPLRVHCMSMYDHIYITALSDTREGLQQPRIKIESPSTGLRATNDGHWPHSLTNPFPFLSMGRGAVGRVRRLDTDWRCTPHEETFAKKV